MTTGHRFRIGSPTIAVMTDGGRRIATIIPEGDIVEVTDSPTRVGGLIHVRWKGETVEMFVQDLRERGQQVKGVHGSSS
jgi:hypothetical protein